MSISTPPINAAGSCFAHSPQTSASTSITSPGSSTGRLRAALSSSTRRSRRISATISSASPRTRITVASRCSTRIPIGGLQVQGRNGEWVIAHPVEDTLVVNIGDLMARWTNDQFKSTPHRVINRSGRDAPVHRRLRRSELRNGGRPHLSRRRAAALRARDLRRLHRVEVRRVICVPQQGHSDRQSSVIHLRATGVTVTRPPARRQTGGAIRRCATR